MVYEGGEMGNESIKRFDLNMTSPYITTNYTTSFS